MIKLAPSILSADFSRLGNEIEKVEKAGVSYIHIDVMDGLFVPNISFGHPVIKSIRKVTSLFFDVHLMIESPERQIESFAAAGADGITIHVESSKNVAECLKKIKALGLKSAISIKPATKTDTISTYLPHVDMVLVMSVEPGRGGQRFIENTLEKVKELAEIKKENNYTFDIEIDGGVTINNLRQILDAGANIIVAGSSIFGEKDVQSAVEAFNLVFNEYK